MQNSSLYFKTNNNEVENVDFFTSSLKKLKKSRKLQHQSDKNIRQVPPLVLETIQKTEQSLCEEHGFQKIGEYAQQQNMGSFQQGNKAVILQNEGAVTFIKVSEQRNVNKKYTQETRDTAFIQGKEKENDKQEETGFECPVCCLPRTLSTCTILNCGHQICSSCLLNWATEVLKQPRPLQCPFPDCKTLIDLNQLKLEHTLAHTALRNYKRHLLLLSLVQKQDETICPNEYCQDGIIKVEKINQSERIRIAKKPTAVENEFIYGYGEQPKQTSCDKCGGEFCSRCLMPLHAYVGCKSWQVQLLEIQTHHNFCQCDQCGKVIEKSSGCNHITCKCGYQFCFLCGVRWRLFHLCNPFTHSQHRHSTLGNDSPPTCSHYAYFILVLVMKVVWAIFSIIYIIPILLVGQIVAQVGLAVGLILMGMTYCYGCVMCEYLQAKQSCRFLVSLVFPIGMGKGIALAYRSHGLKFRIILSLFPKLIDLVLPFSWVPYAYT